MRLFRAALFFALCSAPLWADGLTFTLDTSVETVSPGPAQDTVLFSGTLTDTDTANTCDSENVDCLYLDFISFSFDQPNAPLTPELAEWIANVPGSLSDDSIPGSADYTGVIFGMTIAPNAAPGVYTGTVTISGGYDDPNPPSLDTPLATTDFTVVVTPEPRDFGLVVLGIAGIVLAKRRVAA
jgi:hypothetical protein